MKNAGTEITSLLNFRDIGGVQAAGGGTMKRGLVYRSASPDGIARRDVEFLKAKGIKTVIDLRGPSEYGKRRVAVDGAELVSLPLDFETRTRELLYPWIFKKDSKGKIAEISNSLYVDITDGSVGVFRRVLELVSGGGAPVLIHCQAGKDRTGVIIALLQMLLGVDREIIVAEYLKSNEALLDHFRRKLMIRRILTFGFFPASNILFAITVRESNIATVINRVNNVYGGIVNYLAGSGFDMNYLPGVRKMMTDD